MAGCLLLGCQEPARQVYRFRAGHVANEDHTWHQAFLYFGHLLDSLSQGRIRLEVYPAEQLGKEQELLRSIKAGIADITITGGTLQNWCEIASFSDMPFLIKDSEHLRKVAEGDIGRRMKETILRETGLRVIAIFERGARNLTSNRPIRHPDDLKGLLLRVPNVPSYVAAWEAMGAKPTPMAFSEVFTSLQQGTIQAQENPYAMIASASFYEVQQYLNLTEHVISWGMVVVGEKQFQALPEELKGIFLQAAEAMQEYEHRLFLKVQNELKTLLQQKGMQFIEVDQQAFRQKAGNAVYESLSPEMQQIYREIKALE
ncbi:MAG: TRAP transporter substrate-binding protein [Bacteroidetes bacterium]|nr:MAG: TRAP transporter substrate-binding protein [Bacteroidota bacterium]